MIYYFIPNRKIKHCATALFRTLRSVVPSLIDYVMLRSPKYNLKESLSELASRAENTQNTWLQTVQKESALKDYRLEFNKPKRITSLKYNSNDSNKNSIFNLNFLR